MNCACLTCSSVFTDHGTLLSHSDTISRYDLVKFAAFTGTTWRNYNTQAASEGFVDPESGAIPAMSTVDFKLNGDDNALQQLILEMNGTTSVIRPIIPRLLLAAQLESNQDGHDSIARAADSDYAGHENSQDGDSDANDRSIGSHSNSPTLSASSDSPDVDDRNDSDPAGHAADSQGDSSIGSKKPSKIRILMLKAEGMADFLAEEYPAKLPHDFY